MKSVRRLVFVSVISSILAVAAHADIASKEYVDDIVESVDVSTQLTGKADKITTGTDGSLLVRDANGGYKPASITITVTVPNEGTATNVITTQEELGEMFGGLYSVSQQQLGYINDLGQDKTDKITTGTDGSLLVRDANGGYKVANMTVTIFDPSDPTNTSKQDTVNISTMEALQTFLAQNMSLSGYAYQLAADMSETVSMKADKLTDTSPAGTLLVKDAGGNYVPANMTLTIYNPDGSGDTSSGTINTQDELKTFLEGISTVAVMGYSASAELANQMVNKQDKIGAGTAGSVITNTGTAGTVGELTLGQLATAAPGACANPTNKCVLVFDGTNFTWEVVER